MLSGKVTTGLAESSGSLETGISSGPYAIGVNSYWAARLKSPTFGDHWARLLSSPPPTF